MHADFRRPAGTDLAVSRHVAILHPFISPSANLDIRCITADILWQPSNLPCLEIPSTVGLKAHVAMA